MKSRLKSLGGRPIPSRKNQRRATDHHGTPKYLIVGTEGLLDATQREIRQLLKREAKFIRATPNEVLIEYSGALSKLLSLRTAAEVYHWNFFKVPRPRSLLSPEYFSVISKSVRNAVSHSHATSFRLEAAGKDSETFTRLASQLEEEEEVQFLPEKGEIVLRLRRDRNSSGWEVLTRLTTRPLSVRTWRIRDYPGALNGPLAAAILQSLPSSPDDEVLNMMTGSGTLLIERTLWKQAKLLVGIDISYEALQMFHDNAVAAKTAKKLLLLRADSRKLPFPHSRFNQIIADLPWGELERTKRKNYELYKESIVEANRVLRREGALALLTQNEEVVDEIMREFPSLVLQRRSRLTQRGFHPYLFVYQKKK